jgi:hypothetical protein
VFGRNGDAANSAQFARSDELAKESDRA